MKKWLRILPVLFITLSFFPGQEAQAAAKTLKKTVEAGKTYNIQSPAFKKTVTSVKIAKSGQKYLTAKKAGKKKKYFILKGKKASPKAVTVTVKSNKRTYKYKVTVVKKATADGNKTTPSDKPNAYHNNGTKCSCGGSWEKYTVTDTYKPDHWYLGYATNNNSSGQDKPQEWCRYIGSGDAYYPLRVSAVEAGYSYDHTDLAAGWRGFEHSAEVALDNALIPKQHNGVYVLHGNVNYENILTNYDYPIVLWTTDRGGQVAKMSVDNYKQTQVIDTGFYHCKKCGAIKQ